MKYIYQTWRSYPTTPTDLDPGEVKDVELEATDEPFDCWTAHPEVGDEENHDDGEHDEEGEEGEHREEDGEGEDDEGEDDEESDEDGE